MKKLLNSLGVIILSQTVSSIIYTLLWVYLFSLIFSETLQLFKLVNTFYWTWIPAIWICLMLQKMYDKHTFYKSVKFFKMRETKVDNLYSFPRQIKYIDGSTDYADGTIKINHTKFKKFSYKNTIRSLKEGESNYLSGFMDVRQNAHVTKSTDLIKGMNGLDLLIGIFGSLILFIYVPSNYVGLNNFEVVAGVIYGGLAGILISGVAAMFPFIQYGFRVRVINKIKKLPKNKIDKRIKRVLTAILLDKEVYPYF